MKIQSLKLNSDTLIQFSGITIESTFDYKVVDSSIRHAIQSHCFFSNRFCTKIVEESYKRIGKNIFYKIYNIYSRPLHTVARIHYSHLGSGVSEFYLELRDVPFKNRTDFIPPHISVLQFQKLLAYEQYFCDKQIDISQYSIPVSSTYNGTIEYIMDFYKRLKKKIDKGILLEDVNTIMSI